MVLEKSIKKATSQDGTISYSSLQFELNKANTSAAKMVTTLAAGGKDFTASLNAANAALALSNRSAITLGAKMKEIWRVTTQSFKFTAAQTFLRAVSSEAQQAVRWVTDLNAAVNEIAVVTGKTGNEVTKVTEQAIKGSQQLKVAAKEYAQGALIFYQQGLNDEEVTRRNEITIKASLAANQSIAEMSKQLTAIWNTYGMVGEEQERAASVGAALAAQTAVDFKDIATAMQTAAAPAAQMGVEYNQLAAIIATVGDVTQQSASTIGNAYKTIFSRFQQLKAEGTDGEVTLSSVSKQLESMGIRVLDSAGNLRELGVVINEVGQNWNNWTQTQQTAIAQIVGGTRQYGQFLALMENFDKYQKNLGAAEKENGSTLTTQYEQALDSIEHKAEMSAEAWKRAFAEAIPEEVLKTFYDSLTMVADVFGGIIAGAGGLPGILAAVGVGLSGKIVPALITGAKNAQVIANSLTKAGRERNINNEYDSQKNALKEQDKALKSQGYTSMSDARLSIQAEQEKLKLNKQIALMNEQINNRMKTATAEEKIGLTIMQNRLKLALEENQAAIDRNTLLIQEGSQMTDITTALQQQTQEMIKQAELEEKIANAQMTKFHQGKYGNTGMTNQQAMAKYEADANNSDLTASQQDAALQRYLALKQQELAIQNKIDEAAAKRVVYDDLNKSATAAGDLAKRLLEAEKNITKLNAAGSKSGKMTWKYQKEELKSIAQGMLDVGKNTGVSEEKLKSLQKELNKLGKTVPEEGKKGLQELLALVQRISEETGATSDDLTQFGADIVDTMEQRKKAEETANQVKGDLKTPKPVKIDTAQMVSGFVQVGAAAAGAASAVMNLWDIASNPDLTGTQKLIQALGQLPIIIMSIKTISEQGSVAFDNMVKMGAKLGQSMNIGGKGLADLASGATAAEAGLGATAAAAGIAAVAILAVVAAVAAIVFAYKEWKNQQPETQLKRAEEAAKNLESAEQAAKERADSLREAIENYDSAVDKLDECTKGTKEWDEALQEVNSQVSEILKKFPELLKNQDLFNKDGSLNSEVLKQAQEQADKQVRDAHAATLIAQANVYDKQAAVNTKQTASNYEYSDGNGGYYNIGHKDYSTATVASDLDKVLDSYSKVGSKALELSDIYSILGNVTDKYAEDVLKLAQSHVDAAQAMENANKILVNEWADSTGQELVEGQAELMAQQQQKYYDEFAEAFKKASNQNNKAHNVDHSTLGDVFNGTSFEGMSVTEAFNKYRGTTYSLAGNGVRGTDTNRSYVYLENGEEKEYKMEEMQAAIAAAAALEKMGESAKSAGEIISNLGQSAQRYISGGDLSATKYSELKDIAGGTEEERTQGVKDMFGGEDNLKKIIALQAGVTLDEVTAEMVNEFVDGVLKEADAAKEGIETAGEKLPKVLGNVYKDLLDSGNLDDLTADGASNITDALTQVFNNYGKEGVDSFASVLNKMGQEVDDFANVSNQIEWNSESPEHLRETLKDLGVECNDLSDDDLQALINALKDVGDASVDAAQDYVKNLNDATKSIDGDYSIISDEDFEKLREAGINVDAFFQDMGDGTHQLMEDADAFKQFIHDVGMGKLQEAKNNAIDNMSNLNQAQKWVDYVGSWEEGSTKQTGAMAYALMESGQVDNTTFEGWREKGWDENSPEVAEQIRQAYADAGMSSEKIDEMMIAAADEAERAQQAMDNSEFQFEVESAGLDLEETSRYAERLAKKMAEARGETLTTEEAMKKYGKAAQQQAINNQKLDRGLSNLSKNLKDYKTALNSANKGTAEWSNAMNSLKTDLADIVGFDDSDLLSDSFAESTLASKDLELALNGDVEAIQRLQTAAADDMIINIVANQSEDPQAIKDMWTQLKTDFENFDLTAPDVDQTELINSFNEMIANGKMTKDQIEAALAGLHVSANVKTDYIEQPTTVPTTITEQTRYVTGYDDVDWIQADGSVKKQKVARWRTETNTFEGPPKTVMGYVPQYTIEGTEGEGGVQTGFIPAPPAPSSGKTGFTPGGGKSSGSSGGGGGSSKTPEHKAKKADSYNKLDDRYSTIKSKIEDVGRALEDYSNAEDDAFGAAKLAAMEKQEKSLVEQAKHYKTLRQMALKYLEVDKKEAQSGKNRTDLKSKLSQLGLDNNLLDVQFDDDGYVANRTEIIQQLDALLEQKYNTYKAAADAFDASMSTNETESERIDKLKEEYDGLDELVQAFLGDLDKVDETAAEARQALLDELDKIREWMQKKIDKANYKLELRMSINEMDIKMMELSIKLWDKLGVKMGDTFNGLHKNLNSSADSLQGMIENSNRMWEILGNISKDSKHQAWFEGQFGKEAWQEYLNGNGGLPDSVIQNLEDKANEMMSTLEGMYDTAQEMLGQFVEAMNMFLEEFDKIADKLSRQNEKLEMFENLLEFSGKKYSVEGREAMMGILNARVDNAKVAVANAKAQQDVAKLAVEEAKKSMEQFQAQEGSDVNAYDDTAKFFYNQLKTSLDEAEAAAAEAESNFYASMQELTEAARSAIEESARIIEEELVDSLGGIFDSFDSGLDMYSHQETMDNFFLDDYDKGFELNKLLREINKSMEDVTDPERLAEWGTLIDDINAANQDGVQITQTDLDILKARFDLQKAYDEYTDARAQKNTMRLTRDASGNYSYVYSGDQSAESDGQAKIEEALHNIHKMHREAADEMQSMWFQTYVEMEKYMASVDQLRLQNDEEYAREVQWYKDMYQKKLEHYRDQTIIHNQAIDRSYSDTTLGVITGMQSMEGTHDWYMQQAVKYDDKLKESALSWEKQVRDTCRENGINYDTLEQTVQTETKNMIDENEALRKKIVQLKEDGVRSLQSLGSQIRNFVSTGVNQLRTMKQAVEELIQALQRLKQQQLAAENAKSSYYDQNTDYSALGANLYRQATADGSFEGTYEDFLRKNSYLVDQVYAAQMQDERRGQYYKGNDSTYSWEDALKHMMGAVGTSREDWDFRGESNIKINGDVIITGDGSYNIKTGEKIETASGGLISTPQVRSLAEEGPELVLNATDTENILKAVQAVRHIVQAQIGAVTASQFTQLQERTKQISSVNGLDDAYKAYVDAALAGQEQNVKIEASFPGVSVASEIEEAFNQLVTQAAQYRIKQDR